MNNTPLPEPVYHQWRKKKMPWSLEFAFNSMCHATTDDSEIRTLHTADQMHAHAAAVSAERDARIKVLEDALSKIDAIRNDIIGRQKIGWSSHVYPLVAALDEAGYPGLEYEAARAALGDSAPTTQPSSPSPRS